MYEPLETPILTVQVLGPILGKKVPFWAKTEFFYQILNVFSLVFSKQCAWGCKWGVGQNIVFQNMHYCQFCLIAGTHCPTRLQKILGVHSEPICFLGPKRSKNDLFWATGFGIVEVL